MGEAAIGLDFKRVGLFLAVVAALMLFGPVREYLYWTYKSAYYTHVVLIPLVCAYLVFTGRKEIFGQIRLCLRAWRRRGRPGPAPARRGNNDGLRVEQERLLCACGVRDGACCHRGLHRALRPAGVSGGAVSAALSGLHGTRCRRPWRSGSSGCCSLGSAEFVAFLFPFTGVPVLRDGVVFHLPGLSIEVAPECSGIRSSMALVITCVLAGHMFLKTTWKKAVLVLAVLPVTMLKNGIRIVTLSVLAVYVDRGFLESSAAQGRGDCVLHLRAAALWHLFCLSCAEANSRKWLV